MACKPVVFQINCLSRLPLFLRKLLSQWFTIKMKLRSF